MSNEAIPEAVIVVTEAFAGLAVDRWGCLIAETVELRPRRLVIDLKASPLVDAAGIAVLLQTHRTMIHAGGHMVLRRPTERTRRIMRLSRLDQVFEVEESSPADPVHVRQG